MIDNNVLQNELSMKEILIENKGDSILLKDEIYETLGFMPFAIDHGGWVFNISMKNDDILRQVWLNRFDNGEEDF